MNKRLAFLLSSIMIFSNINLISANEISAISNTIKLNNKTITTTGSGITTTGSNITTTGGSMTTTDSTLKCGITDKVITTEKGTIEILDDGTIITTGDTTYNPMTGSFDIPAPYYTNYEKIYIGGYLQDDYGGEDGDMLRYGVGDTLERDYSFIYNGEVYMLNKGDIYTRWFMIDYDDADNGNIMPILSFMKIDNEWFLFERSTFLYNRYAEDEEIDEIVALNKATVQLEEEVEIKSELQTSTFRMMRSIEQNKTLPDGCLLILTEGNASYITDFGIIPQNTIINYPDGTVELIDKQMSIIGENINVKIQNMDGRNNDVTFKSYVINKIEVPIVGDEDDNVITPPKENVNTPVTPSRPSNPSYYNDDDSDDDESVVTSQKLDKSKQYEYKITNSVTLKGGVNVINLEDGDRIILRHGLEKISNTLPVNTLIIKADGKKIVLDREYTINRKLTFVESKERYISFIIYINSKPYEIVIRIK